MDNFKDAFKEASKVMSISKEAFEVIGQSVNNTMKQIRNLAKNIKKVDNDKSDVLVSIEEISSITEDLAALVGNVTESIGKQEVAMQSTSKRTEELKKVSETLSRVVEKFKN